MKKWSRTCAFHLLANSDQVKLSLWPYGVLRFWTWLLICMNCIRERERESRWRWLIGGGQRGKWNQLMVVLELLCALVAKEGFRSLSHRENRGMACDSTIRNPEQLGVPSLFRILVGCDSTQGIPEQLGVPFLLVSEKLAIDLLLCLSFRTRNYAEKTKGFVSFFLNCRPPCYSCISLGPNQVHAPPFRPA